LSHRQQESSPPPTALFAPTSRQQAGVPLTSLSQNPYHASTSTFYETVKISVHGVQGSGAPWHYAVPPGRYPVPQHCQATLAALIGSSPFSLPDPSFSLLRSSSM